ncbi:hypothetical protein [Massilia sp. IC2-476]|uniref:hypothetical protein n=1 Tax=Massilia sp. IC2-476 TaxID=2887199 RepID=UPI001D1017AF|nr:hypothetical protein [Massilia sp. IC2-476]MCC2973657.1 hypothetical protein [Massilia sp. IC2-476]
MRAFLNLCSLLVTALAPLAATAAVPDGCGPLNDPEGLARSARIILVGEIHGTREYPALAARLACAALDGGRPVTLALEIPQDQQARLDAYMASSGGDSARAVLTSGSRFWERVRDGRSSMAVLALIEQARRWREHGLPVGLIAIDKPRGAPGTRDEHMAARVRHASTAAPELVVIALTGNMHNRLAPPSPSEMAGMPMRIDTPMGVLLRDLGPATIGNLLSRGASFSCMPDCRVHGEDEAGPALAVPVIARAPQRGGAYTHVVELGHTSASLPALAATPRQPGP